VHSNSADPSVSERQRAMISFTQSELASWLTATPGRGSQSCVLNIANDRLACRARTDSRNVRARCGARAASLGHDRRDAGVGRPRLSRLANSFTVSRAIWLSGVVPNEGSGSHGLDQPDASATAAVWTNRIDTAAPLIRRSETGRATPLDGVARSTWSGGQVTWMMRSSPARGVPLASRLDVVIQKPPPGAASTVRSRPYRPW
jgi:hypothetical protein